MNKTIYSVPKVFGGFGLTIILNLLVGALTYKVFFDSTLQVLDIETWLHKESLLPIVVILTLELLMLKLLFNDNRLIIVTQKKIIFICWCLPIIFKSKNKTDYQGRIFDTEENRYGHIHRVMYFIQNDKIVDRISSFNYSNYDELILAMELNKMRGRKISYWKKFIVGMTAITIKL